MLYNSYRRDDEEVLAERQGVHHEENGGAGHVDTGNRLRRGADPQEAERSPSHLRERRL